MIAHWDLIIRGLKNKMFENCIIGNLMKIRNWKIENSRSGQSLIEILIALAIGSVLMGAASLAIIFMTKSGTTNQKIQTASLLAQSMLERVRVVTNADWFNIYNLTKTSSTQYYLVTSSTALTIIQGKEGILEDEKTANLAGYWKFDEATTTTAHDFTSNNNDALISGATRTGSCKVSSCLSFNGTGDYATSSDAASLDLASTITVAAWIKPTDTNDRVVVAKRDDLSYAWELAISTDAGGNKLLGRINSNSNEAQSSSTVAEGSWSHAAMTYDGSNIKVYLNCSLENTTNYSSAITTNNVDVSIGRRLVGASPSYFSGLIDDLRIYNTALSADDIRSLCTSGIFSRYFYVDNAQRNSSGDIVSAGGTNDPSTQKVTVVAEWLNASNTTSTVGLTDYLTRWKNRVFQQTDWSGGVNSGEVVSDPGNKYASSTEISTSTGAIRIKGL